MEDSRIKGKKKKKKAEKSEGNFAEYFLNALNRVRENPQEFATKILDSIVHIRVEDGKTIFDADGTKVGLVSGEEAFRAAAQRLLDVSPAGPLEFREDLVIQVPEDSKEWKNNTLISQLLAKKKSENGSKYPDCTFNMDLGVSDAETSLLLQIVDDSPFKGKRRENLLNPANRYFGISYLKQKSKFCCYVTFAK